MNELRKAAEKGLYALELEAYGKYPVPPETMDAIRALHIALDVPDKPIWANPEIQNLIKSDARKSIVIRLIEQLIEDPNFETTSSDMEYWEPIHDKLHALLTKVPSNPLPECTTEEEKRSETYCNQKKYRN